jgi:hypothetical protein
MKAAAPETSPKLTLFALRWLQVLDTIIEDDREGEQRQPDQDHRDRGETTADG